ncbi:Crp/Fnr family transcriptional regulator [Alkalibacillus sp. S2W]|uniref:Crp/Fnr family transcriptional regulator n=1 Tax=Alkalibacillus TaxID=331654 RepID=UPI0014208CDC|nr:Crp/Fnr family transcriptional regulator [Alkalibacillus almallahensis]NIK13172.1 CRP/FNR family transcriptional regulator [Alkalibacillus almallahensis]
MEYSKLWYLSRIGFFETLPSEIAEEALECIHHNYLKRYTIIQRPDDPVKELYFIKAGSVRIYSINEEGRQFTYSMLGPGSTYGKINTFSLGIENVYIETLEPTHLCSISESAFNELSKKHPTLLNRVIELLSERLQEREEMMKYMALYDVRERLIYLLQNLYNRYGHETADLEYCEIEFPLTHQELANMIGVTREAITGTLKKLTTEGLVRLPKRKKIEIHRSLTEENPLPAYIQTMYSAES